MSLDGRLLGRAMDRLEEMNRGDEQRNEKLRRRVYARLPRVAEIDRIIAGSFADAAYAALDSGSRDPEEALRKIAIENLALQAERAELMCSAGFEPDCLDEKPRCEKCSDRGFYGTRPCDCLMKLYAEEQRKELSQLLKLGEETFDSFHLEYYDDRPDRNGISPRARMEVIYEICLQYARKFGGERENLFMSGGPGLGKTFLSTCIAKVVSEAGWSVVYDTAVSVFARFEEERFSRNADIDGLRAELDRYMSCDLLILDDLGAEMSKELYTSTIYEIINNRICRGLPMIVSTNYHPRELSNYYPEKICSRLNSMHFLGFCGNDIRRILKKQ